MKRRLEHDDFLRWLRRRVAAYPSQQACAEDLHISPGQLSDVLRGQRPPSRKFLAALKARLVQLVEIDAA